MAVVVGEHDGRRAGDAGSHGAHAGGEDRGDEHPRHALRQLVDDKKREHIIRFQFGGRHQFGMHLIESVERRSDEEEDRRDRYEEIAAEERRETGRLVALGRMVALHIVLVDAVVLQVDEDTVDEAHPEGGLTERRAETAQREFPLLHSDVEGLCRSLGHGEEQDDEAGQRPAYHDESLYGLCPYHALYATHHRVEDDGRAGHHHHHAYVPSQQDVHGQRQEEDDGADARHLREQVADGSIPTGPESEALLQEAVGRHTGLPAVERHEIFGGEIRSDGYGEAEDERVPVGRIGFSGISQVADAAHIGREDRHAHHPSGYVTSSRGKLIGRAFFVEERASVDYDASGAYQKDNQVDCIHGSLFWLQK